MNVESESISYASTEGDATLVNASDVEMVVALDSSGAKTMRNVQTQHGDYRSVDEGNVFLIARCLWPDDFDKEQSEVQATTSSDTSASASASGSSADQPGPEETEQCVWIEPFANEVCS